MPDYVYNPASVQASIQVWPKDDYEVIVGTIKAFLNKNEDGSDKNWGIRTTLQLASDDTKRIIYSGYLHSAGAAAFVKGFQLACYGYPKTESNEQRFNTEYKDADWALNFETGDVGEAWKQMEGQRIIVSVDSSENKNTGEPQQQFRNFRPVGS